MRIRTVKPEFWQHEKVATVPREVRMLAVALLNWSDDHGYFRAHPALIAGALLPFDDDGRKFVAKALPQLQEIGFLEVRGDVGRITNFETHQVISRPSDSRLADKFVIPDTENRDTEVLSEDSRSTHGVLTESSVLEVELGSGSGSGSGSGTRAASVDELRDAWNSITKPPIPRWDQTPKHRRRTAEAALKRRPLGEWRTVFERIQGSDWCRGSGGWHADPDWALRPAGKKPEPAFQALEGTGLFAISEKPNKGPVDPTASTGFFDSLPDDPKERSRLAMEALG